MQGNGDIDDKIIITIIIVSDALLLDTDLSKTSHIFGRHSSSFSLHIFSLLVGKGRINQGLLLWYKRNNLLHWAAGVSALMSVPV